MRRPWHRRPLRAALFAAIAYLCLSAIGAIFLAEGILHLPHRPLRDTRFITDAHDNLHAEVRNIEIRAADGADLRAWYAQPANDRGAAVVLLHGMGDNRSGVAGYAKLFLSHDYRVLLPDSRAHGESGGAIVTYGIRERDDVYRWTQWLKEQPGSTCVYGFGESMGAAIILQTLATGAPLCAVVAESPFSTFEEIAYDRIGSHFHAGPWLGRTLGWLPIQFSLLYMRLRYGVDLANASPESAIAHSQVPVLLIHGASDTNIPPRHSRALYAVAAHHARLWIVPRAEHTGAWATAPLDFENNVLGWFGAHQFSEFGFGR